DVHRPCQYSSEQGRFEFVLPPGKYNVKVYSEDPDKAITLPILIRPGQRDLDLTKYLDGTSLPPAAETESAVESEEGRIEGRIIDINTGKGIPGVQLAVVPNSSPASNERFASISAEDGSFAIGGLQSGEYLLQGDFPSVDVDVVSGRSTKDVLIGVRRGETAPVPNETTAEQQGDVQIMIGMRVIEMPADAMKDVFEPNESLSSGLLVRQGHEIAGRLLTLTQERKDAKLMAATQVIMLNNQDATMAFIKEEPFIRHYELIVDEPGKFAPQIKFLEAGWKFKIHAKILESGEKVHIELATRQQEPGFETLQYRPGYDYQIPSPPEIFVTDVIAKNGEPFVISRLKPGEPAFCLIVTPSAILPERQPEPLLGKKLPEPDNIQNIDDLKQAEGKPTLICFWDMNQRPSRNLVSDLAKREKELSEKNIAVYMVHTSNIEPAKLKEWLDNQNVPFACGNIENDADNVLFRWGVLAQPWLILTDEKGVVRAEGFDIEQLDEKLQKNDSDLSIEDAGKTIPTEREFTNQKIITGVVRDEKGKPLEGVKLILERIRQVFTSDTEGKFEINLDPLRSEEYEYTDYLLARHEKYNLAAIVELDEDVETLDIKLKPGVIISGKVVDPENRAIAGASITLFLQLPMLSTSIGGLPRQTTDSEGNFELKVMPTGHEYWVQISDYGYRKESSMNIQTDNLSADRRVDIGRIKLPVASLSVSGIVVDANDKPVANADVSIIGEHQPPDHVTQTDFDGKFIFEKVSDVIVQVWAITPGRITLHGSVVTYGGATDVKIIVTEQGTDRFLSKPPHSLVGSKLPELQELQIAVRPDDLKNRKILLCFWDMERKSRNSISELAKREKELAEKNVIVLLVHTSGVEPSKLKKWLAEHKIPFSCGNIKDNVVDVLSRWGMRREPWLILTDENGIVRAEGFSLEQLDEKLQEEESAANNSSVPVLAKSATPSGVDKSVVKVDLSVVEVSPDSKMDRETTVEIKNLLGGKITLPDSPAVADLLRTAAEATAAVKDETAGDKRVTQKQFKTLLDLLVSRSYVKILMNPTLEVVDGGTAQIRSEQKIPSMQDSLVNLIQITPNVLEHDYIILQVEANLIIWGNEQTPIPNKLEISTQIRLSPGESSVIGGTEKPVLMIGPNIDAKITEVPTTETFIILTPTIVPPLTEPPKQPQTGIGKDQILIDTKVLTVSDEFLKYIGLDPNSVASSKGWSNYLIHSSDDSASFVIDQLHTDLIIKAAATHKDIQILHSPQALVESGKKIEMTVPKPEYYMLAPPSEPNGSSDGPESKSNRIELGTTIRLTPNLSPDRKNVELDFEWESRQLRGFKEHPGPDGNVQKIPQVAVESIKTPCTVPDGKTLLITGKHITVQKKKEPQKLRLADLPLVGGLFSSPTKTEETRYLLILVKPSIDPQKIAQVTRTPKLQPLDP
ncbi:carboxypeptidase regulatory-like domain-containing protein, partial [Planctomycetota bacterium]